MLYTALGDLAGSSLIDSTKSMRKILNLNSLDILTTEMRKEQCNDYPVLGGIDELNNWEETINLTIAVGNPIIKKNIIAKITNVNVSFPTLIHPNVIMEI